MSCDAPIHFLTQSRDPVSCQGKPVERTNEINLQFFFIGLLHWFPVATDRIARLSQKLDRDHYKDYVVNGT